MVTQAVNCLDASEPLPDGGTLMLNDVSREDFESFREQLKQA